jgi:DNA-binding XRE family transcriptional regulator
MSEKKNDNQVVGILTDSNQLHLTLEQELAIELWESGDLKRIAAAVGVTPEVLRDWENQNIFRLVLLNEKYEDGAEMNVLQAVALTLDNVSFADAEKTLELAPGTITEWAKDSGSPFATLFEIMMEEACETEQNERYDKREAAEKVLKEQQMLAIPHILAGKSDAQVAEAVGVARETVNRWRNHDRDFQDELSQSRVAHIDARVIGLSSVNAKAIEVMEEFLDSDDEQIRMRAAMHLLKTVPLTHKNQ